MKKLFLTLLLGISLLMANAQYKHSLGLAIGRPSGISYKAFVSRFNAVDITLGGSTNYYIVAGTFQFHSPLDHNMTWYWGPGVHAGLWNERENAEGVFMGVDGVIGMELVPDMPFAFSVDLRPGVNFTGNEWDNEKHWFFMQSQLSVRYVFNH